MKVSLTRGSKPPPLSPLERLAQPTITHGQARHLLEGAAGPPKERSGAKDPRVTVGAVEGGEVVLVKVNKLTEAPVLVKEHGLVTKVGQADVHPTPAPPAGLH